MQNNVGSNDVQSIGKTLDLSSIMQPNQSPMCLQTEFLQNTTGCQIAYPEIYYKIQPHVLMACDQLEASGCMRLTQAMAEQITDAIYDSVCKMHPDIAKCESHSVEAPDPASDIENTINDRMRDRDDFRRRDMRRDPFRDLINILFFSEFLRRRRRIPFGFIF